MKSANTITAEQYDVGHSLEGVTAIDFGPVSADDAKALAERMANKLLVVRPAQEA